MPNRRRLLLALVTVAVLGEASCTNPTPPGAPAAADVLAAKTRGEMLRTTTLEPTRCTWSRPGFEVCAWLLGDRNAAWYALADSIDTRARVVLICEFPTNGGARERDCVVHPAASPPTTGNSPKRVRLTRADAQARLDAATTVWAVSDLVGDAPARCSEIDADAQFCVWELTQRTHGFGSLLPLLDERARLQLSCSFARASGERVEVCRAQPF